MPKAADAQVRLWEGRPAPEHGPYRLIGEVLRDAPSFPNAACRNIRPAVFDAQSRDDARAALGTCLGCDVLAQCHAWANQQDARMRRRHGRGGGLDGIYGGELFGKSRRWVEA